ncbi:MAG: hypothetical protein NVSMB23_17710 [Myxococcales bacterium]
MFILRRDAVAPEAAVQRARRAIGRLDKAYLDESYFTTFWLPRVSLTGPRRARRHPVEELVALLWATAKPPRGCAGVEWWIGRAYTDALPIGFHFDHDVKGRGRRRHPLLSSVFFFNRVRGGQLALTDQLPGRGGAPLPAVPTALSVAVPRRNRYVVFRGDRFHGVLDAQGRARSRASRAPSGRLRVTLVINFWDRRPTGVPLFVGSLRAAGALPSAGARRTAASAKRRRRA